MANLNLYKSFYDVVRYDGFTNASKATNISQPALSYSIKTLEKELNTILINRSNNQFKITEEGKILYANLITVFEKIDNFEKNIKYNSESFSGTLNIGVRGNACEIFLPKILHEFHLSYPKVIINILMKTSDELYQMFDTNEIDCIIEELPLGKSRYSLNYIKLSHMDNCFVTRNKEIYNKVNCLKDLEDYPIILPTKSKRRNELEKILQKNDVSLENTICLPNSPLTIQLVKEGVGIGYLIKGTIIDELNNEELYELKLEEDFNQLDFALVYSKEKMNNIMISFISIAKKYML